MDNGLSDPPANDSPARAAQIAIRTRIRHIFLIVTTLNSRDILAWAKIAAPARAVLLWSSLALPLKINPFPGSRRPASLYFVKSFTGRRFEFSLPITQEFQGSPVRISTSSLVGGVGK
jgi:hypothetical protein